tara:strand:+ start:4591 stop:5229 length:639 start_codon:yes stop_codon:yes gene_type:complete
MSVITPGYIANFMVNLFIFILLACVYTYIQKLETDGCECALTEFYPAPFIKNFSIFALVFLIFVMFIPPGTVLAKIFGKEITGLYLLVVFIFYIVFAVWVFITMTYTRKLITEKCKCSEDIRRELVYAGTTIEMILIVLLLLTTIIFPLILSGLAIFFNNIKSVSTKIESNLKNPVSGIKNTPKDLEKIATQVKNMVSTATKGVKSLTKKNK